MTALTVVVGNPKPMSRTRVVAEAVAASLVAALGAAPSRTIDLADRASALFDWGSDAVAAWNADAASSDVLVVASPTYKATYTGLLKAFLDRYESDGLRGVIAVPVMVGAAPVHAMAPEVFLRPLLVELGATVPCRSLYVLESQLDALDDVVAAWAATAGPLVAAAAGISIPHQPEKGS